MRTATTQKNTEAAHSLSHSEPHPLSSLLDSSLNHYVMSQETHPSNTPLFFNLMPFQCCLIRLWCAVPCRSGRRRRASCASRDCHGPRGPRQNVPPGCVASHVSRCRRGRGHYAAHRRFHCGNAGQRRCADFPRHPWTFSVQCDAGPRSSRHRRGVISVWGDNGLGWR